MSVLRYTSLDDLNFTIAFRNGNRVVAITPKAGGRTIYANESDLVDISGTRYVIRCVDAKNGKLSGTSANEILVGDDRANVISGAGGADYIVAGGVADLVYGGAGNDTIFGGDGNDTIFGGNDNDVLGGGDGRDWLAGQDGNDWIYGNDGNDLIDGGAGDDHLYGGEGNDWIRDLSGRNTISGGRGIDTFDASGLDFDNIFGCGLTMSNLTNDLWMASTANDRINFVHSVIDGLERVIGTTVNDSFLMGSGLSFADGREGNDLFRINSLSNEIATMKGGLGDDIYEFEFSDGLSEYVVRSSVIEYSSGLDVIRLNSEQHLDVNVVAPEKSSNNFIIEIKAGAETYRIEVRNGWSAYRAGDLTIATSLSNDIDMLCVQTVMGNPMGAHLQKVSYFESMVGSAGDDVLSNSPVNQKFSSYSTDLSTSISDAITEASNCTMTGGLGDDEFRLWSGATITDFGKGRDSLAFAQNVFGTIEDVMRMRRTEYDGGLVITTPFTNIDTGIPIKIELVGLTEAMFLSAYKQGRISSRWLFD